MNKKGKIIAIIGTIAVAIIGIAVITKIVIDNKKKDVCVPGFIGTPKAQKMQTFNSYFTSFKGIIKGAEVKNLYNEVRFINAGDETHKVIALSKVTEEDIHVTKNYLVRLIYATGTDADTITEDGYDNIIIGESEVITEKGYIYKILIEEATDPMFNKQFSKYLGTNSGSELVELYNIVDASNVTNKSHQIIITGVISKDDIIGTENYYVTLVYADEDSSTTEYGYICEINIKKSSKLSAATEEY